MFVNVLKIIGHVLHLLTGFLVHPSKGGCCDSDFGDVADKFKDLKKDK